MIYLYGYEEIKRLNEERRARSMARHRLRNSKTPPPAAKSFDAELIELVFEDGCCGEREPIGA